MKDLSKTIRFGRADSFILRPAIPVTVVNSSAQAMEEAAKPPTNSEEQNDLRSITVRFPTRCGAVRPGSVDRHRTGNKC